MQIIYPQHHHIAVRSLAGPWPGTGRHALTRRDYHGHLAAFHFRELLDLGDRLQIIAHPFKDFQAQILMRHFPAPEAQGNFYLITTAQKLVHRPHLYIIIVMIDVRAHLDFLNLDDFLFPAGFVSLFLRLEFELAIVEYLADRGFSLGGYLHQVETDTFGTVQRIVEADNPNVLSGLINQAD